MQDITAQVGQNLRELRQSRRLSLDKLALLSGVSKSMLGQIERGESSPTIATLWKISHGLKMPFTQLLTFPPSAIDIVRSEQIRPLVEDEGRYRLYPLFPIVGERTFEVYRCEIDPGGYLAAEGHPEGTEEYITILGGALTLTVDQQEQLAAAGDAVRFVADRPHTYRNAGTEMVSISMIIRYR